MTKSLGNDALEFVPGESVVRSRFPENASPRNEPSSDDSRELNQGVEYIRELYEANTKGATKAISGWNSAVKRSLDFVGAIVGLVLFFPVIFIAALVIKISDGGPIFFRQRRVGLNGEFFVLYKFRSMVVNAEKLKGKLIKKNQHTDNRTFKILNDPRITKVGRIIRRLSVDELPQFWNVLRGDMSLVGPRPALPSEVAMYKDQDFGRLSAKPGLTCIWQVSGRSNLDFQQQLALDLEYIEKQNLWLDLKLIAKTPLAVVRGDGAA